MKRNFGITDGTVFIVLLVLVFVHFHDTLSIPYYSDDLQFVYDDPSSVIFHYFSNQYELNNFYRPLQATFLASGQALFGMNTAFIHITHLLLHTLLAFLIYRFMRKMSFSYTQGIIAAIFMIVSQANSLVVLSNDTFSHLLGTLTGVAALYFFFSALKPGAIDREKKTERRTDTRAFIFATILFAVSLFSKETSMGYLPCFILITATGARWIERKSGKAMYIMINSAPFVAISLLYLWARSSVVTSAISFGSHRYGMNLGMNIIYNIGRIGSVLLSPVSSVTIYIAAATRQYGHLAVYIGMAALFFLLLVVGIFLSGKIRLVSMLILFSVFSLIPVLILNHVSELYAYSALPFLSIITGISLGESLKRAGMAGRSRLLLTGFAIIAIFSVNVISSSTKAGMMVECGNRSEKLLMQAVSFARDLPVNGELVLIKNSNKGAVTYSLFIIDDLDLLKYGEHVIRNLSGRNDISVQIAERSEYERSSSTELLLTTDSHGTIIPYNP